MRIRSRNSGRVVRLLAAFVMLLCGSGAGSSSVVAQTSDCVPVPPGNVDQASALPLTAPGCYAVSNDPVAQAVFSWNVTDVQASHRWSIAVSGIAGNAEVLTLFQDPGDPTAAPAQIAVWNDVSPDAGSQTEPLLLYPGAYFVGAATAIAGAFTLSIKDEGTLPTLGDEEPNDSLDAATPLTSAFSISGNLQGSDDWYSWTISKSDSLRQWRLRLEAPLTESITLYLRDASGNQLAAVGVDQAGYAEMNGLGLDCGDLPRSNRLLRRSPPAVRAGGDRRRRSQAGR